MYLYLFMYKNFCCSTPKKYWEQQQQQQRQYHSFNQQQHQVKQIVSLINHFTHDINDLTPSFATVRMSVCLSAHLSPICFYVRLFLYQSIYLATVAAAIDIYVFFSSCWFPQCFSQSVHRFVHLLHSGSKSIFLWEKN